MKTETKIEITKISVTVAIAAVTFFFVNKVGQSLELQKLEKDYFPIFQENFEKQDSIHLQVAIKLLPKIDRELAVLYGNMLKESPIITAEQEREIERVQVIAEFEKINKYNFNIQIYYRHGKEDIAALVQEKLEKAGCNRVLEPKKSTENFFRKVGHPNSYDIRYNNNNEKEVAEKLCDFLGTIEGVPFETRAVNTQTDRFVSIMIY